MTISKRRSAIFVGGRVAEHIDDINRIYDKVRLLEADLTNNAEYRKYISLKQRMSDITNRERRLMPADHPATDTLVDMLANVSGVNATDHLPPFANFKENTLDTWQYVPDQAVRDYLDGLCFMDTSGLYLHGNKVTVNSASGKDIPVPLSLFVNAAGFDSWEGRGDESSKSWSSVEYGFGGHKSIDTIKHYAALPTDIPPISMVNIYVQPNGTIFADNESGDSHRIGAAFLRGQDEVTAETVNFVRLEQNFL